LKTKSLLCVIFPLDYLSNILMNYGYEQLYPRFWCSRYRVVAEFANVGFH